MLEIGPGAMVVRAPVLHGLGARRIWYVDPADSAPTALAPYRAAAAAAQAQGLPAPDLTGCADRGAALARCGATLLIGGPGALASIPDGAVDLVVSEAVLEHVRREDIAPLLLQLRRVTAPDGVGLHFIDFQDHLGGGLQHLRFSDAFWASPLVGRAGVYVNRLGLSAMVSRFRRAGFVVTVAEAVVWEKRPSGPANRIRGDARRRRTTWWRGRRSRCGGAERIAAGIGPEPTGCSGAAVDPACQPPQGRQPGSTTACRASRIASAAAASPSWLASRMTSAASSRRDAASSSPRCASISAA